MLLNVFRGAAFRPLAAIDSFLIVLAILEKLQPKQINGLGFISQGLAGIFAKLRGTFFVCLQPHTDSVLVLIFFFCSSDKQLRVAHVWLPVAHVLKAQCETARSISLSAVKTCILTFTCD